MTLAYEAKQRQEAESPGLMAKEAAEFANRAKSDFLAAMSHENPPMNAIIGHGGPLVRDALERGSTGVCADLSEMPEATC